MECGLTALPTVPAVHHEAFEAAHHGLQRSSATLGRLPPLSAHQARISDLPEQLRRPAYSMFGFALVALTALSRASPCSTLTSRLGPWETTHSLDWTLLLELM